MTDTTKKKIPALLRSLRERRGETQADFAAYINSLLDRNYTKQNISKWESETVAIPSSVEEWLLLPTKPLRPRRMVTTAVALQKGGVGKTTTSVNLAYALSKRGYRVLVIDCDPQNNASTHLGFVGSQLRILESEKRTIKHSLLGDIPIKDIILATPFFGLSLVASTISLASLESYPNLDGTAVDFLKDQLATISKDYDFAILDCSPSLSLMTNNCLTAADYVLIPVQTNPLPIDAVPEFEKSIKKIQRKANVDLEVLGIVPTIHKRTSSVEIDSLAEIKERFNKYHLFEPIPHAAVYAQSSGSGRPTLCEDGIPGRGVFASIVDRLIKVSITRFGEAQ